MQFVVFFQTIKIISFAILWNIRTSWFENIRKDLSTEYFLGIFLILKPITDKTIKKWIFTWRFTWSWELFLTLSSICYFRYLLLCMTRTDLGCGIVTLMQYFSCDSVLWKVWLSMYLALLSVSFQLKKCPFKFVIFIYKLP